MGFIFSSGSIGDLDRHNPPGSESGNETLIRDGTGLVGETSMVLEKVPWLALWSIMLLKLGQVNCLWNKSLTPRRWR